MSKKHKKSAKYRYLDMDTERLCDSYPELMAKMRYKNDVRMRSISQNDLTVIAVGSRRFTTDKVVGLYQHLNQVKSGDTSGQPRAY